MLSKWQQKNQATSCLILENMIMKINELKETLNQCLVPSANQRKIPPLHLWSPKTVSEFDLVIKDNGQWWHDGTKMTRQSLIDLFASVLWAEYDEHGQKQHFLKTPTDKYQITVMDAPLFINTVDEVEIDGVSWLVFGTTNQDKLYLNDDSPLYFKNYSKDGVLQERLYMDTRFHLTACVLPNVLYQLVELGHLQVLEDKTVLDLQSGHKTYRLISNLAPDNW